MKDIIYLRPVREWMESHIESHMKICYLAFFILSYLSFILKKKEISGSETIGTVRTGYRIYLEVQKVNSNEDLWLLCLHYRMKPWM